MSDRPGAKAVKEGVAPDLRDLSLSRAEAALILEALEETDWNLKRAAGRLKIARGTLYSKIKKHGIRRPSEKALP